MTKFWDDVAAAHDQVQHRQELRIKIESERKSAFVTFDNSMDCVVIKVKDVPTTETKEALPVP